MTLQVQPFYLVSRVKAMIRDKEGIPLHNQRLIFSGKDMQDDRTLRIYNVQKETTLEVSIRLLGGGLGPTSSFMQLREKLQKTTRQHRLARELKNLRQHELEGVYVVPRNNKIDDWNVLMDSWLIPHSEGPPSEACRVTRKKRLHLRISFPMEYPMQPPSIVILTPIPHPVCFNTSHEETTLCSICMDMLKIDKNGTAYRGWTPAYNARSVLIQLKSLLDDESLFLRDVRSVEDTRSQLLSFECRNEDNMPVCEICRELYEEHSFSSQNYVAHSHGSARKGPNEDLHLYIF